MSNSPQMSDSGSAVLVPGMPVTPVNRNDEWATPQRLADEWISRLKLNFDLAASDLNAKLPQYWTRADDSLSRPWAGLRPWCNPPWSNVGPWVDKALEREAEVSCWLLPARTDTKWHKKLRADEGVFTRYIGRVAFLDPTTQGRSAPREGAMISVVL